MLWFALILCIFNTFEARPQENEPKNCGSLKGHKCVHLGLCDNGSTESSSDLECLNIASRSSEEVVCCKEESIKSANCYGQDGYQCVSRNLCKGLSNDDPKSKAACPLGNDQVCCHNHDVQRSCNEFKLHGFSCVDESMCQKRSFNNGTERSRLAEKSSCSTENQVCCHDTEIRSDKECSYFIEDGYKCLKPSQCFDRLIKRGEKYDDSDNPNYARCENEQVCCRFEKFTESESNKGKCVENEGYSCLQLSECDETQPILKNSSHVLIQPRISSRGFDLNNKNSLCPRDYEVCCQPKELEDYEQEFLEEPNEKESKHPCGIHFPDGHPSYAHPLDQRDGESSTKLGEWPHSCLLYRIRPKGSEDFIGGASLIAPGVLITAAHKTDKYEASSLRVRCGDWDLGSSDEKPQGRNVESITYHPRYNDDLNRLFFDIALIHVETDFKLNEFLNTICLPQVPNDRENNFDPGECVAMGWGRDIYRLLGKKQRAMKQDNLTIMDNEECQEHLRDNTYLVNTWTLHESFLCVGDNEGKDACNTDGGGSLVCKSYGDPDTYVLAGVVSWGIECGRKNVPGVYVSVPDVLCFIQYATTCKHGSKYDRYFKIDQCENWLDDQINYLAQLDNTEYSVKNAKALKEMCKKQ